jgi:Protein of unknown function (DUF4011)
VEVVDELPVELFRILVREGRPMSFVAAPEMPEDEDDKLLVQPRDADGQGGTADRHVDTRLQTNLASARLQSRLLKTERDARTFIEEQGVNILYLALRGGRRLRAWRRGGRRAVREGGLQPA